MSTVSLYQTPSFFLEERKNETAKHKTLREHNQMAKDLPQTLESVSFDKSYQRKKFTLTNITARTVFVNETLRI